MKHTYKVSGMTCGNCKAKVEQVLSNIDGIAEAMVDLDDASVTLKMETHIPLETLQKELPSKYSISQNSETNVFSTRNTQDKEASKIQQLKPLFLILGYIAVASILLNYKSGSVSNGMLDFMGLFFIVFAFFKLLDLSGFKASFAMYDPLAKFIPAYGWIYPFIETALGLLFLMRIEIELALIATIIILGITTIGVTKTLLSKKSIQCACLGTALNLPMTEATFIENALMIIMAVVMLLPIF